MKRLPGSRATTAGLIALVVVLVALVVLVATRSSGDPTPVSPEGPSAAGSTTGKGASTTVAPTKMPLTIGQLTEEQRKQAQATVDSIAAQGVTGAPIPGVTNPYAPTTVTPGASGDPDAPTVTTVPDDPAASVNAPAPITEGDCTLAVQALVGNMLALLAEPTTGEPISSDLAALEKWCPAGVVQYYSSAVKEWAQ